MYEDKIKQVLAGLKQDKVSIEKAFEKLKMLPYEDIGFAKIDHHRRIRRGFPEVILCKNKTSEQIIKTIGVLLKSDDVLATKLDEEKFNDIKKIHRNANYNKIGKILTIKKQKREQKLGNVTVLTAGTSDMDVAEEAAVTADFFGCQVNKIYDVGVAGIHRLLSKNRELNKSDMIIAIAGMEGALPSVVSGMVEKPIIAVPTSNGYGANFDGITPLLSMMNSCSPGVVVVNINNGFGAGYYAASILKNFRK